MIIILSFFCLLVARDHKLKTNEIERMPRQRDGAESLEMQGNTTGLRKPSPSFYNRPLGQ